MDLRHPIRGVGVLVNLEYLVGGDRPMGRVGEGLVLRFNSFRHVAQVVLMHFLSRWLSIMLLQQAVDSRWLGLLRIAPTLLKHLDKLLLARVFNDMRKFAGRMLSRRLLLMQ